MVIKGSGNEVIKKLSKEIDKDKLAKALKISKEELEDIITPNKVTKDIEDKICELKKEGKEIKDINKIVGFSKETIRQILIKNKLHTAKRKSKLNEKDIKLINKLYEKGETTKSISEVLEIHITTVIRNLNRPKLYKHMTEEIKEEMINMLNEGYSLEYIANKTGYSRTTVYRLTKKIKKGR